MLIMMPCLTIWADFMGVVGGSVFGVAGADYTAHAATARSTSCGNCAMIAFRNKAKSRPRQLIPVGEKVSSFCDCFSKFQSVMLDKP